MAKGPLHFRRPRRQNSADFIENMVQVNEGCITPNWKIASST